MSHSLWPRDLEPARLLCPWNSPGKNTGVYCHFLLQGIFPTQELNLSLLHCKQILYHLSHQGSPLGVEVGTKEKIANLGMNLPAYLQQWDWLVGWVKDILVHSFTRPPAASKTMLSHLFVSFRSKPPLPPMSFSGYFCFLHSISLPCVVLTGTIWMPWLFSLVKWNWKLHLLRSPTFFFAEW